MREARCAVRACRQPARRRSAARHHHRYERRAGCLRRAVEGRGPGAVHGLDAALHRDRQHAARLGESRLRGHQPGGGDEGERSRHRAGRRGSGRRGTLFGSAFETTGMKREYTDEHACAGVDAELPEIETWPNQYADYEIEIVMPEFTSVCPKTGLPDFGKIVLRYVPDQHCLELKSYKMYLLAYRDLGIFQENVVNRVLADVVKAAAPVTATVVGDFAARGGL